MSIVLSSSLSEISASARVRFACETVGRLPSDLAICIHRSGSAVDVDINWVRIADPQPEVDIAVPFTTLALRTLTLDSTQLHAELCSNLQLCLEVAKV